MSAIAALPDALPPGDAASAAQLLPPVSDDLRRPAAHRLAHEAYLHLMGGQRRSAGAPLGGRGVTP